MLVFKSQTVTARAIGSTTMWMAASVIFAVAVLRASPVKAQIAPGGGTVPLMTGYQAPVPAVQQQPAQVGTFNGPMVSPPSLPASATGIPQSMQVSSQQVVGVASPPSTAGTKPLPPQITAMPSVQEELEVIQRRSQLIVTKANVTRMAVADPSIIDVVQYSPNEVAVIGLEIGSTTLTLWFDDGSQPLIYLVKTIRDPSEEEQRRADLGKLERKLAALFPNSKVHLIPLSNKIIVKGEARDSEEAARILSIVRGEVIDQLGSLPDLRNWSAKGIIRQNNDRGAASMLDDYLSSYIVDMLEVPGDYQVMLHVRIAELNRSQLRRLGINWEYLINDGRHLISTNLGGLPATLTGIFENGEIAVLLKWLASNGTVKILAEPTLTVLSGHSASFLAGGEFPVPTIVGVDGAEGITTTFRGFGTSLIVTPTVLDNDLIRMEIMPEFSQLNEENGNNGIQGLDSRRVRTTVELREGQTIVIAGLLSHTSTTEVSRIPFLGELPLIGPTLFNAKRATQDETELLVLVTPEIVRPMEPDEVPPLPGFYVTHPIDEELYCHAMTEGAPDLGVYQLPPYGTGGGGPVNVGYSRFNPAPNPPAYSPMPATGAAPSPYNYNGNMPTPGTGTFPNGSGPSPGNRSNLAPVPERSPAAASYWRSRGNVRPAGGLQWWNRITPGGGLKKGSIQQAGAWRTSQAKKPSFLERLAKKRRNPGMFR